MLYLLQNLLVRIQSRTHSLVVGDMRYQLLVAVDLMHALHTYLMLDSMRKEAAERVFVEARGLLRLSECGNETSRSITLYVDNQVVTLATDLSPNRKQASVFVFFLVPRVHLIYKGMIFKKTVIALFDHHIYLTVREIHMKLLSYSGRQNHIAYGCRLNNKKFLHKNQKQTTKIQIFL